MTTESRDERGAEMERLYRIKALEWIDDGDGDFSAVTPFGSYRVSGHRWGFCFDEYYDEDTFESDSLEGGKSAAEANWLERISDALVPV